MEYSYQACLFQGQRKKETIWFDGKENCCSVGSTICAILGLEPAFFEKEETMIFQLESLQERFFSEFESVTKNDELTKPYLLEWKRILLDTKQFEREEVLLHRLTVFLPCYDAYAIAEAPMMRILYNSTELAKVALHQTDRTLTNVEYENNQIQMRIYADSYSGWNSVLLYLEDKLENPYWHIMAKVVFGAKKSDECYLDLLKRCLIELKRLQTDLQRGLFQNDAESKQALYTAFPGPRLHMGRNSPAESSPDKRGKYSDVYEIVSFSELIRAELILLEKIDRKVCQCQICARYFVPYRNTANACQRNNPDYDGKTCAAVFSMREYKKQHAVLDTALGEEYQKHYKAYSKWATEGMQFVRANAAIMDEKSRQETVRAINDEIIHNQDDWRSKAKEAITSFSRGELSAEMAKERIKIPTVQMRSPLYASFRQSVAKYQGK